MVLARALYNWGLGHARDRARYRKLVVLVEVRGNTIARCWGLRVGGLLVYWWNSVCSSQGWEYIATRFRAIRGFSAYREADWDRGVRIEGWIHELREWKRKTQQQEAELADTRLQARVWFFVARLGLWRNKVGSTGVWGQAERDAEKAVQAMVQKMDADQAETKWQAQVRARVQGLGQAICCMQQAAQAWGVGREAELQRQEEAYFIEQQQERNTV